jgi:hypothetical protein
MTLSKRDLLFIAGNLGIGGLTGVAVRSGVLREDATIPPLSLIFVAMALFEFAASYLTQTPLGQFVQMPARIAALIASVAIYMLLKP